MPGQALYGVDPGASCERFAPPAFPVWIWELQDRRNVIYGIPAIDGRAGGAKLATEQYAVTPNADAVARGVSAAEEERMHRELGAPYLPGLGPRCVKPV